MGVQEACNAKARSIWHTLSESFLYRHAQNVRIEIAFCDFASNNITIDGIGIVPYD